MWKWICASSAVIAICALLITWVATAGPEPIGGDVPEAEAFPLPPEAGESTAGVEQTDAAAAATPVSSRPPDPQAADPASTPGPEPAALEAQLDEHDGGEVQPVPGDANPSVRAVVEAAQAGSHPERFSAMVLPAPFDRERFLADPEPYLATPEPGRVYQVAQPGPQVPRLRRLSPGSSEIPPGGQVELVVRTEALMPVTFTSFDLGGFDNQLTTITVQADERGFARTTFHAVSGTIAGTDILAASPVTSGQIHFTITITDSGSPAARD